MSLTDEDIERLSYLEKAFTTIYTDEVPFSFSKTVSKAIDLANLMVLDPKLLLEEEQYYEKVRRLFPPTFRRIREKAPHVRSLSLTDEDIQSFLILKRSLQKYIQWRSLSPSLRQYLKL